jgi:Tfp pilus assembly protein PilF
LAYFQSKQYAKGVEDFDEAIKREQKNYIYFMMRGTAHFQLKQKDKARADFEKVIGMKETDSRTLSDAKNMLAKLG